MNAISKPVSDILACPLCEGTLSQENSKITCTSCNAEWGKKENYPVSFLSKEEEYYWGEIPADEMENTNNIAREKGWKSAVEQVIEQGHPELTSMILSDDRVDWIRFFEGEKLDILDIGSGWGQTSKLLSDNKKHNVVSLEKIGKRAEFQSIRAGQEKIDNITVVNGDVFNINFQPESFNIASFIGVLEWIGVDDRHDNPRDVQIEALKRVHSWLKPGGSVVVGIENRVGFNNFLGAGDHSGLRFTSLMPRGMASSYLRMRTPTYRANVSRNSYRTYTYSAPGYEKLLKEAGFKSVDIYISHPHYAHPRNLVKYNNAEIRKFFFKNYRPVSFKDAIFANIFRATSLVGLGHYMAPHYIVVGRK